MNLGPWVFWAAWLTALSYIFFDVIRVILFFFFLLPGEDDEDSNLLILSYPQYCRYRSMLKRIQDKPSSILTDQFVLALGGIAVTSKNPQIFYCRDTFDHPTLIENESICDEFGKSLHSYFLFHIIKTFFFFIGIHRFPRGKCDSFKVNQCYLLFEILSTKCALSSESEGF